MNENESFYEYAENLFGFDYTKIFDFLLKLYVEPIFINPFCFIPVFL